MSAGSSQVSSESIEKTKQQIRGLVGEIAQLSKSDMPAEEFYAAFLQRVVQALAAVGGAMWILGEGRKPQIGYQINLSEKLLDADSEEAGKHYRLLDYIVASKTPQLVPPLSSAGDERMGGNPTRQLLVIHPMGHDDEIEGLIEIFQRPDTQPNTQRGYLQFLTQMCGLAAEWFKNRKLRDLGDRHSLWAQADQFARAAHESLDVRETCYTIVNEGRRLMGCDRLTIATLKGGRCRVEAVSGQDTLDSRSNVVTLLGNLATKVVKSGEPLWYAGSTEDLPPQIEQAIEEYVDQSYTKSLAVIPLRKSQQVDPGPSETGGVAVEERAHTGQIVGALIIEQIESDIPRDILAPRLDLVYEHSARALSNAIDHNSLFLMPVWRAIGKSAWVVQARTLPKTVTIAVALGLLVVAMIAIPYPYRMWAKGALEPKIKQEVFAPMPGDIMDVKVDHGTTVEAGQELVVMRNPDLTIRIKEAEGQLNATRQKLNALRYQYNSSKQKMTETDQAKTAAEISQAEVQVQSLEASMKLLAARQEQLVVRSPIAGRVITWDAKRLLQNRPVETGQVLLTVAAAESDYEIKLFMPEKRSQKVAANRDAMKARDASAEPKVEYILMTEPGKTYYGKIADISDTTESHDEHGNIVPIRVAPDQKITAGRPGASVSAYVHCGHRPLGWCMLHEAWEWLEANWFF
jgi:multidrug efflux pump subunit AcrA (membrane-fusion protein)